MQRAASRFDIARTRSVPAELALPRYVMIFSTLLLVLIGFIMVYSAGSIKSISAGGDGSYYLIRQLIAAVGGSAVALFVWKVFPFDKLKMLIFPILGAVVLLFIFTFLIGEEVLGAKRWIVIAGIQFQPSEFAKIAIVMGVAYALERYFTGEADLKTLLVLLLVLAGIPLAFIAGLQTDLGTTVIVALGIFGVLWMGGVPHRVLLAIIGIAAAVCVAIIVVSPFRLARVMVLLNPWDDGSGGTGTGYQLIHSYYAFSEGGLFGVGIGNSAEKYLYIPESQTDFVFSVVGEEWGLVGCMVIVALFLAFLWAGLRIAESAANPYSTMVAGGLTVMIAFQAFLNIGCVTGLIPTTGKPLPFISYGGSSEMASLIMVGLILAVCDESARSVPSGARREAFKAIRGGKR